MDVVPYWSGAIPTTGWAAAHSPTVHFVKLGPVRTLWFDRVYYLGGAGTLLTYDISSLETELGTDWCTIGNLGAAINVLNNSATVNTSGYAVMSVVIGGAATVKIYPDSGVFVGGQSWGHNGFSLSWLEPGYPVTL
jgi:hypothetical protein